MYAIYEGKFVPNPSSTVSSCAFVTGTILNLITNAKFFLSNLTLRQILLFNIPLIERTLL